MNQGEARLDMVVEAKSDRVKVLVLVKGLGLGGIERILSESIPHLDRQRYAYEVAYLLPWKDDMVSDFEQANIPVHCLGIESDLSPKLMTTLRRFLREHQFDIIHSHSPLPSSFARLFAKGAGVEVMIHTEHSLPGSRHPLSRSANRVTYPLCDRVISVSRNVDEQVRLGRVFRPKSTAVIHGGVSNDALTGVGEQERAEARSILSIPDHHQIVGNVAHLRAQKDYDLWLDTAKVVLGDRPETTFVIVGREKEAGYHQHLLAHARKLGVADNVRFAGFRPDPYPTMSLFDVFLMTSAYEGFPIALVEAMALGLPVVSTDVGGVAEAVENGVSGIVIDSRDHRALGEAVIALLGDEDLRRVMGEAACLRVQDEFSIEPMVRRIELVYEELLPDARH